MQSQRHEENIYLATLQSFHMYLVQKMVSISTGLVISLLLCTSINFNNVSSAFSGSPLPSETPEIYPLSRKASKLIEVSKSVSGAGTCTPMGWSNRLGSVLTPVSIPGVYTADRPFYWNRIDVGCRMTVVACKNPRGDSFPSQLFIHSPVSLDAQLVKAIDSIGQVRWVVSPNYEHVKYAKEWANHYKDATMVACPGLMDREDGVYDVEIPHGIRPGDACSFLWDLDEIKTLHIDVEENPFTGKPFFNEVIFFHQPSQTLLVTDTYWNYPGSVITNENYSNLPGGNSAPITVEGGVEQDYGVWELAPKVDEIPFGTKAWKFGMDKIYRPFYLKLMIKDTKKASFESIVQKIIDFDVETIIPAHGDIVRGKSLVRRILKDHFSN